MQPLGVRRRHAPKKFLKIDPRSGVERLVLGPLVHSAAVDVPYLYSYGPHSYGVYSYGLHSSGPIKVWPT